MALSWKSCGESDFSPREGTAFCLVNNTIYMFGGVLCALEETEETNELLKYSTETREWVNVAHMGNIPSTRSGSTISAVDKNLYLFGGLSVSSGWMNDVHVFNTETNTWKQMDSEGELPSPRDKLSSCVIGLDIYYFGGFGPISATPMMDSIEEEGSDEDELGVMQSQTAANFTWFDEVYMLSTTTGKWTEICTGGNHPSARAAHSMSVTGDNTFIIFGGKDSKARQNDTWEFNINTKSWTRILTTGKIPCARSFHASVYIHPFLVVYGGRGTANQHFNDIEMLNLETKQWSQIKSTNATIPPAIGLHALFVVKRNVYMCGGSGEFNQMINCCTKFNKTTYTFPTESILELEAECSPAITNGVAQSSSTITAS